MRGIPGGRYVPGSPSNLRKTNHISHSYPGLAPIICIYVGAMHYICSQRATTCIFLYSAIVGRQSLLTTRIINDFGTGISLAYVDENVNFDLYCCILFSFGGVLGGFVSDAFALDLCKYPPVAVVYFEASFGCAAFGRERSRAFLPERPWIGWVAALHSFESVVTLRVY